MLTENIASAEPLALMFTACMALLMFSVRREYAVVPLLITAIYVTLGEVIVVAGLHFTMFRLLILCGWLRLVIRGEVSLQKLNTVDKCIILWVVSAIVVHTLQRGTTAALVNRLGLAYNALGLYFLFRCLIKDMSDVTRMLKIVSLAVVPLTLAMIFEWTTGQNVFSVLGGVNAMSMLREGRVRCQGSFTHPIIAGTFGATIMPLLAAMWFQEGIRRWLPMVGVACATLIMMLAHSSGPFTAYAAVVVSFILWPFRSYMRAVRWIFVFSLLVLHMVMKAPVWALMGRLGNIVGGDGWHRTELIDQAVHHFDEWWLVGTGYTMHWLPFSNEIEPGMADITNQYVVEGVHGGLVTLLLFVTIIAVSFRAIGRTLRTMEGKPLSVRIMVWSMGAALLGHVISFFSVSYFDQIVVFWYFLLAAISCADDNFQLGVKQHAESPK